MLCEIQFSNLFINKIWSFKSMLDFVLQQLLPFLLVILICEWFQIDFWDLVNLMKLVIFKKKKKNKQGHCRSLFLQSIRCERWRHMCNWLKNINFCLRLFFFSYTFCSKGSSWTNQEQILLTWLGSIGYIITTLNFSFLICEMSIMKPRLWSSSED